MKKALIIFFSVSVLASGAVAYFLLFPKPNETTKVSEKPVATVSSEKTVRQDAEVLAALNRVGYKGDISDLNLLQLSKEEIQAECDWVESVGCFREEIFDKYTMYVASPANTEEYDVTVAHEYLHYIFKKEQLGDDAQLIDTLYDLRNKNSYINDRIGDHYLDNSFDISSEIFSYGCTELTADSLSLYLDTICNKYIDTSKLTYLR